MYLNTPGFSLRDLTNSGLIYLAAHLHNLNKTSKEVIFTCSDRRWQWTHLQLVSFKKYPFRWQKRSLLTNKVQSSPAFPLRCNGLELNYSSSTDTTEEGSAWGHWTSDFICSVWTFTFRSQKDEWEFVETKNKSSCIKSLTIYKQICQPWCFPQSTGYLAPAHSCMCVCLKESASGLAAQGACLYRPCLTHIVMMWPKGPCLPRTHTCTHTHM